MINASYTDGKIAKVVEENLVNFAGMITESYFQNNPDVKTMDPKTYAQLYFNVFKDSVQMVEQEIMLIRQSNNEKNK